MKPAVLIIDDSLTVRMDLSEAFARAALTDGWETTLCANLATARHALSHTPFSLIVLDVNLPDGDGIDFLKELKSSVATADIPVMLLSTAAEVHNRVRGLKTGADEYIGKPYDTGYVVSRARELIPKSAQPGAAGSARTVLIIDDSPTFREALRETLVAAGYAPATSETGEEGLRAAVDLRPAAIIVDGHLPGIDGATVIRRIRTDDALRRTPCLLLTGSEEKSNEVLALDAGADAYVRKESEPGILLARLAAILRAAPKVELDARSSASTLLGPKRILAIDDSATYLNELAAHLREEGYEPILANSGEEGLELLAAQPVDCILLDLIMPGLSGQDTCRKIKSSPGWRDVPLMLLTSLDENDAMIAGIDAGADDYITKSGDFEVLKARLRAQLRRKQFEDENRRIREQLIHKEVEATEARAARKLADTRAVLLADLEAKNNELEAFSYSVSHDLRAPLRAINGFTQALLEDHASVLPEEGKMYLDRVCTAAKRMGELIDDLLALSRVTRAELHFERVDLSALAASVVDELVRKDPGRQVELVIARDLFAAGDASLLRIVFENLLGNAWKYTSKQPRARIEFGSAESRGAPAYFVRDDGAGFNMAYVDKLFAAFQRLHSAQEFPGTGIGLATIRRIVQRHGGKVWAEGAVGKGAAFYFTLPDNMQTKSGLELGGV